MGSTCQKLCILKVYYCNSFIRCEHEVKITSLILRKLKCSVIWYLQSILGTFDYALAFMMVILKVGVRNEEAD